MSFLFKLKFLLLKSALRQRLQFFRRKRMQTNERLSYFINKSGSNDILKCFIELEALLNYYLLILFYLKYKAKYISNSIIHSFVN